METKNNKNAVIVGVFIAASITIFIIAVFTLGGQQQTFTKKFPLKVLFSDINGLKEGNNIWLSGVKVGTVKTIDLRGNSAVEVTLSVEESARAFIPADAEAKISSDGFLGNKLVVIYGGKTGGGLIQDNAYLRVAGSAGEQDLMASLGVSARNLQDISSNFKTISNRIADGKGTLGKLVKDSTLAFTLQSVVSNVNQVAFDSRKVMTEIEGFTKRLNQQGSPLNRLLEDSLLYDSIRSTFGDLQATLHHANNLTEKLEGVAANVKQASEQLKDTSKPAGLLLNDTQTAADLQKTLENLNSASRKLADDLEAVQHNFLFRGYFRRKAKAEKLLQNKTPDQ